MTCSSAVTIYSAGRMDRGALAGSACVSFATAATAALPPAVFSRKARSMRIDGLTARRWSRLAFAGTAALAALAFATPASAADKDLKGWFLALDSALTQPSSLDQHFATHVDASANPIVTERLVIDNHSDITFGASLGYRFAGGMGSLRVSYWSFENDDSQAGSLNGGVYPTIVGYTYGGAMYIFNPAGVTYSAGSSVKASTADFDYIRPIPISSKFSVRFLAGLRVARYEEDQAFTGNDGVSDFFQGKQLSSKAGGPRVGASAVFGLSRHFGLESGLAVSFLTANIDGQGVAIFPTGTIQSLHGEDDHVRGTIWDYDLRGVWRFHPIDYFLGIAGSDWEGLVADPLPAGSCCSGSLAPDARGRQTVTFTSVRAGFIWRFGGNK